MGDSSHVNFTIRLAGSERHNHLDTEAVGMFRQLDHQVRVEVNARCSTTGGESKWAARYQTNFFRGSFRQLCRRKTKTHGKL